MTTQEKIEAIHAACIAANDDIMKLKFGCEVRSYKTRLIIVDHKKGFLWNPEIEQPYNNSGATLYDEILGRPIHLADVLLAIQGKNIGVQTNGCFITRDPGRSTYELSQWYHSFSGQYETYSWNLLKDDIRDQSPECADFLYSLLK